MVLSDRTIKAEIEAGRIALQGSGAELLTHREVVRAYLGTAEV